MVGEGLESVQDLCLALQPKHSWGNAFQSKYKGDVEGCTLLLTQDAQMRFLVHQSVPEQKQCTAQGGTFAKLSHSIQSHTRKEGPEDLCEMYPQEAARGITLS